MSLQDVLERSLEVRHRRLGGRELGVELVLTLVSATVGLVLALGSPVPVAHPLAAGALVVAYGAASRVSFPIGVGQFVPTQAFLIALFGVAPVAWIPLLVHAGLLVGAGAEAAVGRARFERLSFAGGDALHAIGPVLVLLAFGAGDATDAPLVALPLAFAAQIAMDLGSSVLREWVACGVRPRTQAGVIARVLVVDLALMPIGLLAVLATDEIAGAALLLLPLLALMTFTARDRLAGVRRSRARLEELQRERHRLQVAVRRIGDAFASNLDLDALLRIVTHAAVEALDADGGRASALEGPGAAVAPRATIGARPELDAVLAHAEALVLDLRAPTMIATPGADTLACRLSDGETVFATVSVSRPGRPFEPGERELLAYLCEQASVAADNVQRHEALHRQALTDELTGLANHRRFQEVLEVATARHRQHGEPAALVLLDLDDFKAVNDVHGHHVGDLVLRAVGRCLRATSRREDEPARYGGEEFAVVLRGASLDDALAHAERLRAAVASLVVTGSDGRRLPLTVSAGVAALTHATMDKAELLVAADAALYRAKRRGKDRVEGGPETGAFPAAGPRAQDLRNAVARNELHLDYQPIVRLTDGEVVALEALVRWRHPLGSTVSPAGFIPFAEQRGLIGPIGQWVLEEACRRGAAWLDRRPDLQVSVNVSARQLAEDDFVRGVERALTRSGFPGDRLVLELTESALVEDLEVAARRLAAVRELGVQVACDDFGTGHASLEYLLRLPLDLIKLPRVYVEALGRRGRAAELTHGVLELADRLGVRVVAEGVEDPAQLAHLRELGYEYAQGYLLARPLGVEQVDALVGAPGVAYA